MSDVIQASRIAEVRRQTTALCEPLAVEDHIVQPADFVSPPKWHLAHTTWFFETFVLANAIADHEPFDPTFARLFNSYYKSQGQHWQQSTRGTLSRPTVSRVRDYRAAIDEALATLADASAIGETARAIELGLHHEQQHQELLVMDIKAIMAANPSMPAYIDETLTEHSATESGWIGLSGGHTMIGASRTEFAFDHERPDHNVEVRPFVLSHGLVTNGSYAEFIAEGGYTRPELWLSDGWDELNRNRWTAPRYWFEDDGQWKTMTLRGATPLDSSEPVSHVSYYEADAFARWKDSRLPTELEWEHASRLEPAGGQFLESGDFAPRADVGKHFSGMHGTLWQWTQSPYIAYPGYRQPSGAMGEYNGKFMCNQMVLRGGCYAMPKSHYRPSYRNFYRPQMRWQMSGIRLAKDA